MKNILDAISLSIQGQNFTIIFEFKDFHIFHFLVILKEVSVKTNFFCYSKFETFYGNLNHCVDMYIIVSEGKEKQKTVWVDNYDCSRAAYNVRLAQQQLCFR